MKHNVLRAAALMSGMTLASCGAFATCLDGFDCGIVTGMGAGDTCFHFTLFRDDLSSAEYALSERVLNDKSTFGKLKVIDIGRSLSLLPGAVISCQGQNMPEAKALHTPAKQQ